MLAIVEAPQVGARELRDGLSDLFARQLAKSHGDYIQYHSSKQAIASKVNSFLEYKDYLPQDGRILDWGCHHAPDSAMIRMSSGPNQPKITGCDFLEPDRYKIFWDFSGIEYIRLNHITRLPFEDNSFDCIVGSGALEHTARDYESLKELYRVLKTDGHLIITHLPNRFSYVEFAARHFRKSGFHRRLYSVSEISTLLKRSGFYPVKLRRHRILPTQSFSAVISVLSRYETTLDRIWPLNLLCGDILGVAQKVDSM